VDQSQRIAAKTALDVLAADGFLLAGGQALAEHGISSRPSEDIDLFALHRRHTPATFAASVRKMTAALESVGYTVEITRQYDEFASVTVGRDDDAVVIDLGLDWWENSPAIIDVGPVLSLKDSVASKLLAVYSRGYAGTTSTRTRSLPAADSRTSSSSHCASDGTRTLTFRYWPLPWPATEPCPPPTTPDMGCLRTSSPNSAPPSWTSPGPYTEAVQAPPSPWNPLISSGPEAPVQESTCNSGSSPDFPWLAAQSR
jgi:hypothetical protein